MMLNISTRGIHDTPVDVLFPAGIQPIAFGAVPRGKDSPDQTPSHLIGYSVQNSPAQMRFRKEIPGRHCPRQHSRKHAPPQRAAAPRRVAIRQGQCRVDSRPVQRMGLRREDRDLRRAFPHAERTRRRTGRAHAIPRQAAGAGSSPSIPPRIRPPSSFPPTTPTPSMATSPLRWCT